MGPFPNNTKAALVMKPEYPDAAKLGILAVTSIAAGSR